MKTLARFYKAYYEWINYAIIALLCLLCCFFYDATWFLIAFVAVCACFYSTEKLVALTFVIYLIQMPLLPGLFPILMIFVMLMFAKNFLIKFFKRKQKIELKTLIVLLSLVVYAVVTHLIAPYTTFTYFLIFISDIFILYFTFLARKEIDVLKIVRIFVAAIIITGVICYVSSLLPRFEEFHSWYIKKGLLKNWGMTENPNHYAGAVLIAISSVLALFFFNKIELPEFVISFVMLYVCGYLTISRNFLLSVAVALVVFGICYLVRHGFKALELLIPLCAIVCAVCLLFEGQTFRYFDRINNFYELDSLDQLEGLSEEEYRLIFAGLMDFNPGRFGIWKIYFKRIFSSPIFTLFGLGVSAVRLGRIHPHNAYIQWLYKLGIVGMAIVCLLIFMMVREEKTKNKKNKIYYFLIAIFPVLFMLIFDIWNIVNIATIIFLLSFMSCAEWESSKFENETQTKMIKSLLKKPSKF